MEVGLKFVVLCLDSVLLLELLVLLPEGVAAINHDLDELNLGVSQTVLVGDVIGEAIKATGLSTGSPGLDSQLLAPLLEGIKTLLGVSGEVDHDGCPHASAQVGGAGVDVAVLLRQGEVLATLSLDRVSHSLDATGKAREDLLDVSSLLHGDDPHLILLIDPEQEGLLSIVEDATALGPVTLHASGSEVAVSRHEEEVVIDKLLADLLVHASEGVVGASKVTSQLGESVLHESLNSDTLLLGDSGGESVAIDGYGLSPGITKEQRVAVEALMKNALSKLTGDLAGTYYPLTGMGEKVRQQLVDAHFLFVSGDRNLTAAGMERDWPEGRGIFH